MYIHNNEGEDKPQEESIHPWPDYPIRQVAPKHHHESEVIDASATC